MKMTFKLISLTFALLFSIVGYSQEITPLNIDTLGQDSITFITTEAEDVSLTWDGENERDTLIGTVEMTQDSLFMICDRAYVVDNIYAWAYENVVIIHEDSLTIFADSLYYDGLNKIAELYGKVILKEGEKHLYTNELTYYIEKKTAHYTTGGTIIEGNNTIKSREGFYYSKFKEAKLIGNVSFKDSTKTMFTDSIRYLSAKEQLNFISPTTIIEDSTEIYAEGGIYRLEENMGVLSQNVKVTSKEGTIITSSVLKVDQNIGEFTFLIDPLIEEENSTARGDTIIYYSKKRYVDLNGNATYHGTKESIQAPRIRYQLDTEQYATLGRAKVINDQNKIEADEITSDSTNTTYLNGAVSIIDYEEGIELISDRAIKKDSSMKVFSEGSEEQPLMIYNMQDDSLYLKADTLQMLKYYEGTDSMMQTYQAINEVQFMKSEVFGRSNNFSYQKSDSLIIMSNAPVLWSDSIQMSADTIVLYLSDNEINKIVLIQNAFILSPEEGGHLNQIKANKITSHIEKGEIKRSRAEMNAEMLYLVRNDNKYEGINITKSKEMLFKFESGDLSSFNTIDQQDSNIYEYDVTTDIAQYYLEGYDWRIAELPIAINFALSAASETKGSLPLKTKAIK
ncbi:MAG: lipopolysaccharide export system protein LptA [Saprospiraceae bacterium]|jgi:lipopolysaccharide export system protein LptA